MLLPCLILFATFKIFLCLNLSLICFTPTVLRFLGSYASNFTTNNNWCIKYYDN